MTLTRFRIVVVIRVILLALTLLGTILLIEYTGYVMTLALAIVLVIVQVIALIRHVEKIDRDLTRFLIAVKYEDFFETFKTPTTGTASRLNDEFTRIMSEFRRVRAEREEQVQYLETVLQHIGTAVLSYDDKGDIELANNASRQLLKRNRLDHIDRLENFSPELVDVLKTARPGRHRVVKTMYEGEVLQLLVRSTEFIRQSRKLTLVTIQDIRGELEEQELEAWQNLIRVLTHEIRNSITPIASLATSTHSLLATVPAGGHVHDEAMEDARLAINTIEKRSQGLLRFVEVFRSLYKTPEPELAHIKVKPMLEHMQTLFAQRFQENRIDADFSVQPDNLRILADRDLIEQVLINLLTNAIQALERMSDARISIHASIDDRGRGRIQVADNGPGIAPEHLDRVFIPFFTTRAHGTGVGLSLSRQIMRLHKGTITVQSKPGEGAIFTLVF